MRKKTALLLSVIALVLGGTSCQRLPEPRAVVKGPLQMEEATHTDAIPLEYGTLVGVTSLPDYPFTAGLWFEKADKTIVFVKVNMALGKIETATLLLPRR